MDGDEQKTMELVQQFDETGAVPETSWLRHTFLGGELDRRLLAGATTAEMSEVRSSWRQHILHLIIEHRLEVVAQTEGYWRIAGMRNQRDPATVLQMGAEADEENLIDRFEVTAQAIAALAQNDLLAHPKLKASVAMLIRQASESSHWHLCAHFRSVAAATVINAQQIGSRAQYQGFCRANLRHEHVVPNNVIYNLLVKRVGHGTPPAEIEKLLRTFCLRATISITEDEILNAAGLRFTMPDGFHTPGHAYYLDPLARYRHVGLYEGLQARGPQFWFVGPDERVQ